MKIESEVLKDDKAQIKIQDDGNKINDRIKELLNGETYTGKAKSIGGAKYYIIREIPEHNNAKISINESNLGGSKFTIKLQRK